MGVTVTQSDTGKPATLGHVIGGKVVTAARGTVPVFDPATGVETAVTALASDETAAAAVEAAVAAFAGWHNTPALQRARVLFEFRQLLEARRDELAMLITQEHGKVLSDADGEVQRGIEIVEFACGVPEQLKGTHVDNIGGGIDNWSMRQPLGVCIGITPFNFPTMVPLWMFPLAIACGNTFVLKPSERDPGASLLLAELLADAGAPAGVLNVVQGDADTVRTLIDHPDVAAVSFVGSTPVAEQVYAQATSVGKRVQALAGAKNHLVVAPDADLDLAADALTGAAFGSAGERCMAISVAVAVGPRADELVARLRERAERLRVGPGTDPESDMGPLITAAHRERVTGYIESGVDEGAELVLDGRGLTIPGHENGFFLGPSIFDRVEPHMRIYKEEIFGPVLSVVRVDSVADAIDLVNAHELANGVSCFTANGGTAREFARRIAAGMVGINVPIPVPTAYQSFGGWKRSIFGDHHIYGEEGIRFYTRYKSIMQRWPGSTRTGPDFMMPTTKG
ncbi:MAG TPA: CoA-acylating methylmalonate-semialdehyde dehydrogenase [Gammaproteobacteria bacterium]|jgi:malonate-semialdehyde dehydrogenase (acetylating)/methylmalonate-semialdehyde dehydrogenase